MKNVLKSTLAAVWMGGMMMSASAQDMMAGQASMEINEKIINTVMKDVPADKMTDTAFIVNKMIDEMKKNLPELKAASQKDCIAVYGEAKSEGCSCMTDKTDYNDVFDMMKKQAANPSDPTHFEKMAKKGEDLLLSCGFTKEEIDAATAKVMEAMQQAAPKG